MQWVSLERHRMRLDVCLGQDGRKLYVLRGGGRDPERAAALGFAADGGGRWTRADPKLDKALLKRLFPLAEVAELDPADVLRPLDEETPYDALPPDTGVRAIPDEELPSVFALDGAAGFQEGGDAPAPPPADDAPDDAAELPAGYDIGGMDDGDGPPPSDGAADAPADGGYAAHLRAMGLPSDYAAAYVRSVARLRASFGDGLDGLVRAAANPRDLVARWVAANADDGASASRDYMEYAVVAYRDHLRRAAEGDALPEPRWTSGSLDAFRERLGELLRPLMADDSRPDSLSANLNKAVKLWGLGIVAKAAADPDAARHDVYRSAPSAHLTESIRRHTWAAVSKVARRCPGEVLRAWNAALAGPGAAEEEAPGADRPTGPGADARRR